MAQQLEYIAMTITAIAAFGGMITGFIAIRTQRKKDLSDASESIAEAAKTLIEPLRKRVGQLEKENEILKQKVACFEEQIGILKSTLDEFRAGAKRLAHQVKALDAVPVWRPGGLTTEGDGNES